MTRLTKDILGSIVVFLLTATIFRAAGDFGLINCDDYDYLLNHPEITRGLSVSGIRWAFANFEEAIWMPLTWISYMTDYSLGLDFGGMHIVSIILHALNASLLFILLNRIFPRQKMLLVLSATLIWSLHPLRVESVVWLASRKDVLSTFFFLISLLAWIRNSSISIVHAALFMLLGSCAKPSVMVFPVFVIIIDTMLIRRRKPWWAYFITIFLSLGIAVEASLAQKIGGAMIATNTIPFWYRILNAIAALSIYLGNFLLPINLAPQCLLRYPDLPRFSLVGSVTLIATAAFFVSIWKRQISGRFSALFSLKTLQETSDWFNALIAKIPSAAGGLAIFFLSLIPFLGIVGFGAHAFADRFTLLPSLGLSIFILALIPQSTSRSHYFASISFLIPLLLTFGTVRQISYWENDGRLFDHTVAVDGENNARALVTAAKYYYEFEHDLSKTHDRLSRALAGRNGIEEVGHIGDLYMEAAFVAGDAADMDDCDSWLSKWDARESERMKAERGNYADCHSIPYTAAEILHLAANSNRYDSATNLFESLKRALPRHHTVRVLAYRLAEIKGDPQEIAIRKAECADCDGDLYMRNRWAR